jgi:hypothetical protein
MRNRYTAPLPYRNSYRNSYSYSGPHSISYWLRICFPYTDFFWGDHPFSVLHKDIHFFCDLHVVNQQL